MSRWLENPDGLDQGDTWDPLCVERSCPIEDDAAAEMEALCQSATPGPFVIEDDADGGGVPVVSLPDGRLIVSMTASVGQFDQAAAEANAELFCKARYMVLRLLRDRRCWARKHEQLQERIRALEAALAEQTVAVPNRPR